MKRQTVPHQKSASVKKGDQFTLVVVEDGKHVQLTGTVEVMMSSEKARKLGLTKSRRLRLFLGLRVEGREKLVWKDRGQVKPVPQVMKSQPIRSDHVIVNPKETFDAAAALTAAYEKESAARDSEHLRKPKTNERN